jgi:hypothetical protein
MPRLYDLELSGNCYKVRLLCALLDVPVEIVPVDFMTGEHKRSPLLDRNPFGEIPIFENEGVTAIARRSSSISRANWAGRPGFPRMQPPSRRWRSGCSWRRTKSRGDRTTPAFTIIRLCARSQARTRKSIPHPFADGSASSKIAMACAGPAYDSGYRLHALRGDLP